MNCLKLAEKKKKRNNIILTPHEGEFNRLFKFGNMDKIDKANKAAKITNSTILFKGNDTIISSPKNITFLYQKNHLHSCQPQVLAMY